MSAANAGTAMPNKATDPTVANKNLVIVFFSIPSPCRDPKQFVSGTQVCMISPEEA
jgi:hypothetical protein